MIDETYPTMAFRLETNRQTRLSDSDKSTSQLWDASHLIAVIGMAVGFTQIGHVQTTEQFSGFGGLVLMLAGIALRWRAITTLGTSSRSVFLAAHA